MVEISYKLLHPGDGYIKDSPNEDMFYIYCPRCAAKVCQVGDGSRVAQRCSKCHHVSGAEVDGLDVTVRYYEDGEEPIVSLVPRRRPRMASVTKIPS